MDEPPLNITFSRANSEGRQGYNLHGFQGHDRPLHAQIDDTRKHFLHKLSTRLINENQVIAVEALTQLEYKA